MIVRMFLGKFIKWDEIGAVFDSFIISLETAETKMRKFFAGYERPDVVDGIT